MRRLLRPLAVLALRVTPRLLALLRLLPPGLFALRLPPRLLPGRGLLAATSRRSARGATRTPVLAL